MYNRQRSFFAQSFTFPAPTGLSINMMPLTCKFGRIRDLPVECMQYMRIIDKCIQSERSVSQCNQVVYLTILEGSVLVGDTQRRPGVHVERPTYEVEGKLADNLPLHGEHNDLLPQFGGGYWEEGEPVDGIYMANSVPNSCRIWPCTIKDPEEVTDSHGGLSGAMCQRLPQAQMLSANTMYWFTDVTPHESLPLLVIGKISIWYAKHNSANPCGTLPDAIISHADKFM
ncbi:hypothetical protein JKP88DRAFT_258376 [Tribonema minus]|uniref:Uncharacterized protein n=1 Tax=Tribonema minus TaxID=303371 RepID=A0A835YPJ1_9STRA|nr:hypothetical protein JKP88DRAFT_258376 [Tribonema minus]